MSARIPIGEMLRDVLVQIVSSDGVSLGVVVGDALGQRLCLSEVVVRLEDGRRVIAPLDDILVCYPLDRVRPDHRKCSGNGRGKRCAFYAEEGEWGPRCQRFGLAHQAALFGSSDAWIPTSFYPGCLNEGRKK